MSSSTSNMYLPDGVSLPGETLQEILDTRQMSQADLADRTGRPRKTINEIIKGRTAITPETALQLERVLGIPASFWNNLEQNYQASLARKEEDEALAATVEWLKEIPVKDLASRGWVARRQEPVEQLREVLNFFGVASPSEWKRIFLAPQASFRHSPTFASAPGALAAWLRRGEIEAQSIRCESFDRGLFQAALGEARALTMKRPESFRPELVRLCARAGVAVVFVRELPKCRVGGATRWLSPAKALIQLSLRYKTNDHLWFSFFHEAGHIVLHGKRLIFLEAGKASDVPEEREANEFASELLVPRAALAELRGPSRANRLSADLVKGFAEKYGVAPGIVVGRLQHEGWIPRTHLNALKEQVPEALAGP